MFFCNFILGNFSLFAVFLFPNRSSGSMWQKLLESVTERLVSGIPDKIKFFIWPHSVSVPEPAPETLVISYFTFGKCQNLVPEILNKRWRTLDLISMMREFKRTCNWSELNFVQLTDRLLSLPRFKKEENLTD